MALQSARGEEGAEPPGTHSSGGGRGRRLSLSRATRAWAAASVFILKRYMARPRSMLSRAIFAHSQNQQQQITLQTMERAPARHG